MTGEVQTALRELASSFPESQLMAVEDGNGGAFVELSAVSIGQSYCPNSTWIGFHLTYQYPEVDVYPHFLDASVHRNGGQMLGEGLGNGTWRGRPAVQVSRRTANWNRLHHNATNKLHKVIEWLRTR